MNRTTGLKAPRAAVIDGRGEDRTSDAGSPRLGRFLRTLREGYGYTLRKVEERAMALGEVIDNSQLSRFEKGKAVPSFEKIRALARIFNVPVQSFSDVLDLEEFEAYKPDSPNWDELLRLGTVHMSRGEHGRAFVTYERALEVARDSEGPLGTEREAEARWRMAVALKSLGKLSMAERELREILKSRGRLARKTVIRALMQLSFVHREFGDHYLASVLGRECLDLAIQEEDRMAQGAVLNSLGNISFDEGDPERALAYYRRALDIFDAGNPNDEMRMTVLTNLGGCLADAHRFEEGIALLREAHTRAREHGYRRVAALSLTRMAEAHLKRGDVANALKSLSESDSLAGHPEEPYQDILFLNAYRRWEQARSDGGTTREKIEFGRLRHLRSRLERHFPEVDEFDRWVESHRRAHGHLS